VNRRYIDGQTQTFGPVLVFALGRKTVISLAGSAWDETPVEISFDA